MGCITDPGLRAALKRVAAPWAEMRTAPSGLWPEARVELRLRAPEREAAAMERVVADPESPLARRQLGASCLWCAAAAAFPGGGGAAGSRGRAVASGS